MLIATSVLFGSHSHDTDVDHDLDHDVDHDLDHDVAHSLNLEIDNKALLETNTTISNEVELTTEQQLNTNMHEVGIWLPFLSLRFWTFFAATFGLAGVALTWLKLASSPVTLLTSIVLGVISGTGVAWLYRTLKRAQVDSSVSTRDIQGGVARVLLPIESTSEGKIRIASKGYVKDLRAITQDEKNINIGEQVLILDIKNDIARVTALRQKKVEDKNYNKLPDPETNMGVKQ